MVQITKSLSLIVPTLLFYAVEVQADGIGLIGYGKTLYNPTCSFACRNVIRKQSLACTLKESTTNHGTAHNPVTTPPKCFVQDLTFLKTMALCIDTYCNLSDKPSKSLIEDYWASHLGTGTLGNYKHVPVISYDDALSAGRRDEEAARTAANSSSPSTSSIPKGLKPYKVSSPLPITSGGSGALNRTSMVSAVQWQLQYNYMSDFEINEKGHSTMAIIIAVVAIGLPLLLSIASRFPALERLKLMLIHPALFGKRHREPTVVGQVPTRGQGLYIALISILNLVLLVAPYTIKQPQASFTTKERQFTSIIGNRAGVMAMGNVVALFLFSARNNFLLLVTNWSYSTYLLLHRWLGYWAVVHTIIHSAMLWSYYDNYAGTYAAELLRLYWQWGIVGTVAVCALIPFSLLQIRQKFYEFFLVSHIALSLFFLLGYYYHIWYVYTYSWGYEIWMFVAAGIWALERVLRTARIVLRGSRTATITLIPDTDNEYIRIEIDGKVLSTGVAYLCFPTLSWRFWETHPFSISGVLPVSSLNLETRTTQSDSDSSPTQPITEKESAAVGGIVSVFSSEDQQSLHMTTFLARTRGGVTKALLARALRSDTQQLRMRVLIEGPYDHSGKVHSQIAKCTSILCIAGGVGITACLPILTESKAENMKLFWSNRKSGLVADVKPSLDVLSAKVKVETLIGDRFDLDAIIHQELSDNAASETGALAVVVSGPPGLADDVRRKVLDISGKATNGRSFILVDEAFSW